MTDWLRCVLEKVPHGEEGHLQLEYDDAVALQKILVNRGYAVMITGGDCGNDYRIAWIYAGAEGDLHWADADQICFTHIDYIADYPEAYQKDYEEMCGFKD